MYVFHAAAKTKGATLSLAYLTLNPTSCHSLCLAEITYFNSEHSAQVDSHIKFEFCDKNTKKTSRTPHIAPFFTFHRNPYTHALLCLISPISPTPLNRFLYIPPKEIKKPNRWKQKKTENVSTKPYNSKSIDEMKAGIKNDERGKRKKNRFYQKDNVIYLSITLPGPGSLTLPGSPMPN